MRTIPCKLAVATWAVLLVAGWMAWATDDTSQSALPYQVGTTTTFRSSLEGTMRTGVAGLGDFEIPVRSRAHHRLQVEAPEAEGKSLRWRFSQRLEFMDLAVPASLAAETGTPPSYERPEACLLIGVDGRPQGLTFASPVAHPMQYGAVVTGTNLDLPLLLAYSLSRPPTTIQPGQTWEVKSDEGDPLIYTLRAEALPSEERGEPATNAAAANAGPVRRWKVEFEFTTQNLLPPPPQSDRFGRMETTGLYTGRLTITAAADTMALQRAEGELASQVQIIAGGMFVDVEARVEGWIEVDKEQPGDQQPASS